MISARYFILWDQKPISYIIHWGKHCGHWTSIGQLRMEGQSIQHAINAFRIDIFATSRDPYWGLWCRYHEGEFPLHKVNVVKFECFHCCRTNNRVAGYLEAVVVTWRHCNTCPRLRVKYAQFINIIWKMCMRSTLDTVKVPPDQKAYLSVFVLYPISCYNRSLYNTNKMHRVSLRGFYLHHISQTFWDCLLIWHQAITYIYSAMSTIKIDRYSSMEILPKSRYQMDKVSAWRKFHLCSSDVLSSLSVGDLTNKVYSLIIGWLFQMSMLSPVVICR